MGLAQMGATTGGRKFKRPYADEINARTPYLPSLYAQRSENEYRDKTYNLNKQKLAQEEQFGLQNLALQKEGNKEVKKRNRMARNLGYANIGLGAGLGALEHADAIKSGLGKVGDMLTPTNMFGEDSPAPGFTLDNTGDVYSSPLNFITEGYQDYAAPFIKNIGSSVGNFFGGIYDGVVGNALDFDWSDAFTDVSSDVDWTGGLSDVIDFGW